MVNHDVIYVKTKEMWRIELVCIGKCAGVVELRKNG
jgi:hypothetical protein